MSAIEKAKSLWPQYQKDQLNSKHEKCRHITEEIYKRIDITFQIKNLGSGSRSDASEESDHIEIDSNELSNGTDLFAYEKSDSIPSSGSEGHRGAKVLTVNNNEIKKNVVPIYKPPRKRFRKKVKKRPARPSTRSDSEGSSDSALPLSRIVVEPAPAHERARGLSVDRVMGVPKIVILTGLGEGNERIKDAKPKLPPSKLEKTHESLESKSTPESTKAQTAIENNEKDVFLDLKPDEEPKDGVEMITADVVNVNMKAAPQSKKCNMCNLSFRGERGLRRHMAISHILIPEEIIRPKTRKSEPV